jgi:hypothetical protein
VIGIFLVSRISFFLDIREDEYAELRKLNYLSYSPLFLA